MAQTAARAYVFSGRPDPTWEVGADVLARRESTWEALLPFDGAPPAPPLFGYRGCVVTSASGAEYIAYGGVVTKRGGARDEQRVDQSRRFERLVYNSAPGGLIPPSMPGTPGP